MTIENKKTFLVEFIIVIISNIIIIVTKSISWHSQNNHQNTPNFINIYYISMNKIYYSHSSGLQHFLYNNNNQ